MSIRAYSSSSTTHPTWTAKTEYSLLSFVIPTTPDGKCYECTTAGVSGTDEPAWNSTLGATTVDGDFEQENPVVWTCRSLLSPNPLVVELNCGGFGGYSLKDIWVRSSRAEGEDEFIVYGSFDGSNWRQIDELEAPHGCRDNRHKGLQNAYSFIKVTVDSESECEIEIVASEA